MREISAKFMGAAACDFTVHKPRICDVVTTRVVPGR